VKRLKRCLAALALTVHCLTIPAGALETALSLPELNMTLPQLELTLPEDFSFLLPTPSEEPTTATEEPATATEALPESPEPSDPTEETIPDPLPLPAPMLTVESQWNLYFGLLHAHTNISDGQGSVEEAFQHAAQVENLDFFAVTDHSNSFDNANAGSILTDGTAISAEWAAGKAAAAAVTDEGFVGIFGYEMTWQEGRELGHINTFHTPGWQSRSQPEFTTLKSYYQALTLVPGSVSQFNHPGPGYGEFENFAYHTPEYDQAMALLEVGGEGGFTAYRYYTKALDKSWHVAPTNNQNNHNGAWGDANGARTVVLAEQLTEQSLYEAMLQRRVYATEDPDFSLSYRLDGQILGGFIPERKNHRAVIRLLDPTDSGTARIEVIADGGKTVASASAEVSGAALELEVPGGSHYYYLRLTQPDGDIAVTAPVWTEDNQDMGISSFSCAAQVPTAGEETTLVLELYNAEHTDWELTSLTIYAWDEILYEETRPSAVTAGTTRQLRIPYTAQQAGTVTFRAAVTGTAGGNERKYETSLTLRFRPGAIAADILVDGSHGGAGIGNWENLTTLANNAGLSLGIFTDQMPDSGEILIIPPPDREFSVEFLKKAAAFGQTGGTIVICGTADSAFASNQINQLLTALGSTMALRQDCALDEIHNGGNPRKLYPVIFNPDSGWCANVTYDQVYCHDSGCTLDPGKGTWLVRGHSTTVSSLTGETSPVLLAAEKTASGATVLLGGSLFLTDSAMPLPGNRWENPRINLSLMKNLLGISSKTLPVTAISRVRQGDSGEIFRIKGHVTSGTSNKFNTFQNMIYLQDDTGGIGILHFTDPGIALGTPVELVGRLDAIGDNPVLDLIDYHVLPEEHKRQETETLNLREAMDYNRRGGSLVQIEAQVYSVTLMDNKQGISRFTLIDKAGDKAVVMIEDNIQSGAYGTNTLASQVKVGRTVRAKGILHLESSGLRVLRVRNCEEVVYVPPVPRPGENPPTGDRIGFAALTLMTASVLLMTGAVMDLRKKD